MSNSSLVNHVRKSPNYSSRNGNRIDRITIHHMAGNLSVETCGNVFAPSSRQASSNYGIDSDGRVGLYVDEAYRSWCSSSKVNDQRAVTIEVADNKIGGGWGCSSAAMAKLVLLCADICRRNGIKKLDYTGNTSGNLTLHKWFANTDCPGAYLESQMPTIAKEVNKLLESGATVYTWDGATASGGVPGSASVANSSNDGKLAVDGSWGLSTTRRSQQYLGTTQDGIVSNQPSGNKQYLANADTSSWQFKSSGYSAGSGMVRALQKLIGAVSDGWFGKKSVTALQEFLRDKGYYTGAIDGSMGPVTVKAWQTYLNNH